MIKINRIDREEAIRYLGGSSIKIDESTEELLDACEEQILNAVSAKYLYKKVLLGESDLLVGESIRAHLKGCSEAYLMCVTLGAEVDRLIRSASVRDMAQAVVLDAMASAAVEQVCDEVEKIIAEQAPGSFLTWRFSPGYGDYPIELQKSFLSVLDAQRKIGLCASESCMLTPAKSVTAIIGASSSPVEGRRRGCAGCGMAKECKFKRTGKHCGF